MGLNCVACANKRVVRLLSEPQWNNALFLVNKLSVLCDMYLQA